MYRSCTNHFKFIHCRDPSLDAERSCLIATDNLTYMMSDAIRDLFEPLRFALDLSRRVLESDKSPRVEEILTFNRCDHKETCLKLEELIHDVCVSVIFGRIGFSFVALKLIGMICVMGVRRVCDKHSM